MVFNSQKKILASNKEPTKVLLLNILLSEYQYHASETFSGIWCQIRDVGKELS